MKLTDYIPADKQYHILAGMVISYLSSKMLMVVTGLPWMVLFGVLVAFVVGALKELVWDRLLDKGTYENADMAFTTYGGALGVGLASIL